MDPKSNGKVSILALVYVLVTNLFGVLLALALFFSFNIGKYAPVTQFFSFNIGKYAPVTQFFSFNIGKYAPVTQCVSSYKPMFSSHLHKSEQLFTSYHFSRQLGLLLKEIRGPQRSIFFPLVTDPY